MDLSQSVVQSPSDRVVNISDQVKNLLNKLIFYQKWTFWLSVNRRKKKSREESLSAAVWILDINTYCIPSISLDDSQDASEVRKNWWQKITFYRNSKSCFLLLFVSVVHIEHYQHKLKHCANHRRIYILARVCAVTTATTSCRNEKWASGKTYRFTGVVSIQHTSANT